MGRWEPNARGRLAQAALTLYAEQGFDQTTAAEIARLAGLKERSFFRHFADKREVLFYGTDSLRDLLMSAIADAPSSATAMDAVSAALQVVGAMVEETPELARLRYAVVSANAELRERELIKHAELAAAMAEALRDRGIPGSAASLAAETGVAVYRVAFARWISEPGQPDLPEILRESVEELRDVLTERLASVPSPSLLLTLSGAHAASYPVVRRRKYRDASGAATAGISTDQASDASTGCRIGQAPIDADGFGLAQS